MSLPIFERGVAMLSSNIILPDNLILSSHRRKQNSAAATTAAAQEPASPATPEPARPGAALPGLGSGPAAGAGAGHSPADQPEQEIFLAAHSETELYERNALVPYVYNGSVLEQVIYAAARITDAIGLVSDFQLTDDAEIIPTGAAVFVLDRNLPPQ